MRSRARAAAKTSQPYSAVSERASQYFELTKPGISLFVGLSAVTGYAITVGDGASWLVALLVLVCTMLTSGGAAAQNHVIEAERDRRMSRTARRPVANGRIAPQDAAFFGWMLTMFGLGFALATLPPLTALLLLVCHISYVNIYTPLKLRTPLCTIAGAIPGSVPVLAGAAASVDGIQLPALLLTGVLFAWQFPHFMAIGWLAREDYARAGYRMLFLSEPSGRDAGRVAMLYAAAMGACAVLMGVAIGGSPLTYAVAGAAALAYGVRSWRFLQDRAVATARQLFFTSLMVLPVVLAAVILETVL